MAVTEFGQFGVQGRDPVRLVRDSPVGRDRRAVVGLEVVAEACAVGEPVHPQHAALGGEVADPVSWSRALLNGSVTVHAPAAVRRALPGWIGQSRLAAKMAGASRPG
ncbi:hypothetical protein [Mycobacterium sp. HUMS_1102779]|uniref:hypothetical protein n=1 Tax=Mycobacterium sp. HUMS_1102779 TaxID=3383487 RepID=UPI00389983A8